MALWVHIWELIKSESYGKLGQLFTWPNPNMVLLIVNVNKEHGVYEFGKRSDRSDIGSLTLKVADRRNPEDAGLLARVRMGEVLEPAKYALYSAINEKLQGQVYTQVAWISFKRAESYSVPRSLLAAMWLMFMWEVTGYIDIFSCPMCGRWVERFDARSQVCSDTCRKRKSRLKSRAKLKT